MSAALSRMLDAAARRVDQRALDRLRSYGVEPATIARLGYENALPAFGIAHGSFNRSGFFEEGDTGEPAHLLVPVTEEGALVDLVAFRPMRPNAWALVLGDGWRLGGCLALTGCWRDHAIDLVENPLAWLRTGATAMTVLDWASPELTNLRDLQAIRCASPALAETLRAALLRTVRLPKIETGALAHAA